MNAEMPSEKPQINPTEFFAELRKHNIGPFVGVPCSLIKSLIAYAVDHPGEVELLNPAHESHAMAVAAGAYMGSAGKEIPMVFLQNSGFGNIINPLTSLHQMYDMPAILLVTWRSEDGYGTDAPEHWIVGENMEKYFETFQLPYRITSEETWQGDIAHLKAEAEATKKPTVLCVRKGLFEKYAQQTPSEVGSDMTSMQAIELIKARLADALYLSTTGMISRESYTVNDTPDLYMMGSMGLLSGMAAGAAMHTDRRVVALDGDGALMMHMGQLPYIGSQAERLSNLLHVVLDNESYSSTGGQPAVSRGVDFGAIAKASGYPHALRVESRDELDHVLGELPDDLTLLHVKVSPESDHGIGRVSDTHTCPEVTQRFLDQFKS